MRTTTHVFHRNGATIAIRRAGWRVVGTLIMLLTSGMALAADPPARVARLSVLSGQVSYAPAGQQSWSSIGINRPLVTGDRLLTGDDSRTELQLGGASVRLASHTASSFLALDEQTAQLELSQGTLNLDVQNIDDGQSYEVDTPTVALVVKTAGEYRIDINAGDNSTTVSVFSGAATVYGSNNSQYSLTGRQSYRFGDAALTDVVGQPLPAPDAFDTWCFARDDATRSAASQTYVSPDVVGASDLDAYGDWRDVDDYGYVWFPRTVAVGWAPYRYGHWVWVAPWGWTWIDNAPWGFAPFHYGRWAYVGGVWGWLPGPRRVRAVYSPALVAFYGGGHWGVSVGIGGGPVGWCPLGPGEVYVPPYRVSHRYFTNVNVTNVVRINHTTINNYYNNGYRHGHGSASIHYRYHTMPGAMTVVTHDAFVRARPINAARLHVDASALKQASVITRPGLKPGHDSLGLRAEESHRHLPAPHAVFSKPLVTHERPSIAARLPQAGDRQLHTPQTVARPERHADHQAAPVRSHDEPLPSAHFARPEPQHRQFQTPHGATAVHTPEVRVPIRENALPSTHFAQQQTEWHDRPVQITHDTPQSHERPPRNEMPSTAPAHHNRLINMPREAPRPSQRERQHPDRPAGNQRRDMPHTAHERPQGRRERSRD